jgi:GTPase involved in cell partitioning and DNA repair
VADVADAFAWYECQQPGLGEDFLRHLESDDQTVLVHCVFHCSRDPEKLAHRLM